MVTQEALQQAFNAMQGTAKNMVGNAGELFNLVGQLQGVLKQAAKALGNCVNDLQTMGDMIHDYADGSYKEVPVQTIIGVTVAVLYVVNPIDIIPDGIPAIGFADDIALVGFVLSQVHDDVDKYREWKEQQSH